MTDKEYREQKKRVQKYIDKWFKTVGLGWYDVSFHWHRLPWEDDSGTAARTIWSWQYMSADIHWYLPVLKEESDTKVENVVVHEFSHVLTGAVAQTAPDDARHIMEYSTEVVARALIWARQAGIDDERRLHRGQTKNADSSRPAAKS
jgi:hypothetical protein